MDTGWYLVDTQQAICRQPYLVITWQTLGGIGGVHNETQWFIFASTESLGGLVPWDLGLAGEHPVPHSHSETDFKIMKLFEVFLIFFQFLLDKSKL